jgi:hypothetical protein
MTDDLAWRLPVKFLEDHPVYGPRLAAHIAEICGDSPARWQEFVNSWSQPTQLLASSLFKRVRKAAASGLRTAKHRSREALSTDIPALARLRDVSNCRAPTAQSRRQPGRLATQPDREALCAAVSDGGHTHRASPLARRTVESDFAAEHVARRLKPTSPLHRAANATCATASGKESTQAAATSMAMAYVTGRLRTSQALSGVTPDPFPTASPSMAGVEWVEVVHPTKTRSLDALRIVPSTERRSRTPRVVRGDPGTDQLAELRSRA